MAYISAFNYCDRVQNMTNKEGQIRNIITPLSELRPINIPGNYTFTIASTITELDTTVDNVLEIFFHAADESQSENTLIMNISKNIIDPNTGKTPDSINIDIDLRNVVLRKEGMYKTVFKLNGSVLAEYPIKVKKEVIGK